MSNGPELPPPGWYQDPENLQGPKRWWDGSDWTDRRRMDGPQPPAPGQFPGFAPPNQPAGGLPAYPRGERFPSLDRALSFGGRSLGANWLPIAVVELFARVIPAVVFVQLIFQALDGVTIQSGGTISGFDNSSLGMLGLTGAISMLFGLAGVAITLSILLEFLDTRGEQGPAPRVPLGPAVGRGLRRMFPLLGWYLLAALAGGLVTTAVFMLLAAAPPLGVLVMFAMLPLGIYVFVRLGFFGIAAVDGPGNPFSRSLKVSAERFWNVFGILALTFLAIFLVNVVLSILSNVVGAVGTPPLEVFEANDDVTITTNLSAVAISMQVVSSLVLGVFMSGFGGGVATLLYRAANPRPDA